MGALRTTCMGLFETLFSSSTGDTVPQAQQPSQHEIFPEDKYNVAYAVAARHEEIRALEHLLEADQTSPTALEAEPFFQDIIEDMERDREYSSAFAPPGGARRRYPRTHRALGQSGR